MTDIHITVAQVQPPPPGKQKGSIKDISGKYWFVWPQDLNSFQPGGMYRITDYDTYNAANGKTYYTIKRYQQIMGAAAGGSTTRAAAPPSENDAQKRLDIFVCGAFNNYLTNPNINPEALTAMDIVDIIQKFKYGWMGVFGPSPLPPRGSQQTINHRPDPISTSPQHNGAQRNDDMNDDIPF